MRFPTLRFVLRSIRPARVEFINSALARVLNTGFDVLLPLLFALVVDEVISRQRLTLLPGLALIFAIILVGTQFLFLVSLWCWASVRNEFNASLREQAFDHLLHVAAGALDRERTADLARTINTDASAMQEVTHFALTHTFTSSALFVVAVAISAALEPRAALLMLAAIPAGTFVSHRLGRWARRSAERLREEQGRVSSWIHEMLAGLADVQRIGAEATVASRFLRWWPRVIRHAVRSEFIGLTADRTAELISMVVETAFFVLGTYLIVGDELSVAPAATGTPAPLLRSHHRHRRPPPHRPGARRPPPGLEQRHDRSRRHPRRPPAVQSDLSRPLPPILLIQRALVSLCRRAERVESRGQFS